MSAVSRARRRLCVGIGALVAVSVLVPAPVGGASPRWSVASHIPDPLVDVIAVACVSPTSCQAVGARGTNAATVKFYAQSWNGKAWTVAAGGGPEGRLVTGVSCVSPTWCRAVGRYFAANRNRTLIESWDGHRWSAAAGPNRSTGSNALSDVSCVSRTSCIAVGSYENATGDIRTLIESWNGHVWSVVPSPNRGTGENALGGVSCVSTSLCTAVGTGDPTSGATPTLIESWNGKVWSLVDNPVKVNDFVTLNRVSCLSAVFCTTVGYVGASGHTFAESWNGKAWSVVRSPDGGQGYNNLRDVSCSSATSCKAVGSVNNPYDGPGHGFVESWNGKGWSLSTSPTTAGKDTVYLDGVSCAAATSCQAVGANVIESFG